MTTAAAARRAAMREVMRLETRFPPRAFWRQYRIAVAEQDAPLVAAFEASFTMKHIAEGSHAGGYRRKRLSPGVFLFRDPAAMGPKRLVVLVTGRAQRLGAPTPMILDAIPSARHDVLYISDGIGVHYRLGMPGIGPDFRSVIGFVDNIAKGYGAVLMFGSSMGASPAMALRAALGAERSAAFAPRLAWDMALLGTERQPPANFPVCACRPLSSDRDFAIHAAGHEKDRLVAESVAISSGARAVGVAGAESHGLMKEFVAAGQFYAVMDALLDLDRSAKDIAAQISGCLIETTERAAS